VIDWETVNALPWRKRNAEVEVQLRAMLASYQGAPLSTWQIASELLGKWRSSVGAPATDPEVKKLSHLLTRMAPHLGDLCRHDGPEIIRYGRKWRRWNWYGQKQEKAA
jgi:hypothetical protein